MGVLNLIYPLTRLSYFLVGPALLFYVRSLLKANYRPTGRSLLHLVPFLLWFAYVLAEPASLHPRIPFGGNQEIGIAGPAAGAGREPLLPLSYWWDLSKNLSRLGYSVAILFLLGRHRREVPDRFSVINSRNTLSWLGGLVLFYTGLYLLNSLVHLILPEESSVFQIIAAAGRSLPAVLFVFLFSLFSEDQPVLAETTVPEEEPPGEGRKSSASTAPSYEKSGLSDEECRALFPQLEEYMLSSRPYLDPDLTLDMLADQMGETRHRISELINRESGKRFFSYINGFRLREFTEAVREDRYPDFTILAVAFECGFGSSSAFYSLVKKEKGMTPKALVKQILSP